MNLLLDCFLKVYQRGERKHFKSKDINILPLISIYLDGTEMVHLFSNANKHW